jgi:hypothetical protein
VDCGESISSFLFKPRSQSGGFTAALSMGGVKGQPRSPGSILGNLEGTGAASAVVSAAE